MSCHYEYVFPELVRRGLWGIFYVPTKPYVEDKMLDVHKIHILCGKFTGDVLLKTCRSRISDEMVPFARRKEFKNFTYNKQNNDPSISIFKRLLNYYVSDEIKEYLIDQISNDLGFFDFPLSFYCSRSELYEMAKRGMVLGSHTVSHPVMSKLNSDKQHKEIISSFDFISKFPDQIHKTYCHPYGGFHSFDSETIRILNQEQVDYSFNVLPKDIDFKFNINDKHSLPRFDCNEFPFGAAS